VLLLLFVLLFVLFLVVVICVFAASALLQDKSGSSAQRLTPVTIAQVNAAKQQHKDDAFSVDGQELNQVPIPILLFLVTSNLFQVSVVGTIKSVAKLSTNITLVVKVHLIWLRVLFCNLG
jgi:hypothetical protein